MKKIILITLLLFSISGFSQKNHRERIKAKKTAFITNALDLSSKEAEKFWPIYNNYDKRIFEVKILKTRKLSKIIRNAGGVNQLSDNQANKLLEEYLAIDFELAKAKQDLKSNLKNIISGKKIIMLFRAEQEFNKKLLRDFRKRRKNNTLKGIRN